MGDGSGEWKRNGLDLVHLLNYDFEWNTITAYWTMDHPRDAGVHKYQVASRRQCIMVHTSNNRAHTRVISRSSREKEHGHAEHMWAAGNSGSSSKC